MNLIQPLDHDRFLIGPGGRLEVRGSICSNCGLRLHPARGKCPRCSEDMLETFITDPDGVIESFTVVHQKIERSLIDPPYALAEVNLTDGYRLRCISTDDLEVSIGSRIRLDTQQVETDSGPRLGLVFTLI